MSRRDDELVMRLGVGLVWSLLVHALVFALLARTLDLEPKRPPEARPVPARPIPILSEDEVDRLIALAPKLPPPRVVPLVEPKEEKKEPPKPPELSKPEGQVVEIPPPPREEVPDDARLLSDYNSKVEKEMVAAMVRPPNPRMLKSDRRLLSPGSDEEGRTSAPNRQRREESAPRVDPRRGDAESPGSTPGPEPTPGERRPRPNERPEAPLAEGDGPFRPAEEETARAEEPERGGGGTVGGSPEAPSDWTALLPTLGPEDLAAQDGSIDHIEDMDKGDQTFLNTREYQYAWFFNRVKRQVQRRWRAVEAHRRNDPYGRVYGVRDRQTVVEVTLDTEGTLEDIVIAQGSGVAFLDEAAVEAFQDASPFPNPPDGLKDPDGRIRFRFAFFLEISGRGLRFLPARPPP